MFLRTEASVNLTYAILFCYKWRYAVNATQNEEFATPECILAPPAAPFSYLVCLSSFSKPMCVHPKDMIGADLLRHAILRKFSCNTKRNTEESYFRACLTKISLDVR